MTFYITNKEVDHRSFLNLLIPPRRAALRRLPFFNSLLKREQSPDVQPLEPIFFPKLQIHFADFPNLHCRVDQSSLNLETCCGYQYDLSQHESIFSPHVTFTLWSANVLLAPRKISLSVPLFWDRNQSLTIKTEHDYKLHSSSWFHSTASSGMLLWSEFHPIHLRWKENSFDVDQSRQSTLIRYRHSLLDK